MDDILPVVGLVLNLAVWVLFFCFLHALTGW